MMGTKGDSISKGADRVMKIFQEYLQQHEKDVVMDYDTEKEEEGEEGLY